MSGFLTLAIHELVWRMDESADGILQHELGINFQSAQVLMILKSHQPMSQRHLASCLGQTPAAITRSLPTYVAQGWVEVIVDPKQPRRNLLSLTPEGEALTAKCWHVLETAFDELLRAQNVDGDAFISQVRSLIDGLTTTAK